MSLSQWSARWLNDILPYASAATTFCHAHDDIFCAMYRQGLREQDFTWIRDTKGMSPSSSISSPRTPRASWRRHPMGPLSSKPLACLVSYRAPCDSWALNFIISGQCNKNVGHFSVFLLFWRRRVFPLSWKFPEIQEIQVVWVQFENEIIQCNNSRKCKN